VKSGIQYSPSNKKEFILTGLFAMCILATVLLPIRDLDQITTLGNEMQYWGGAMTLLGQDWSQYFSSQSIVGYGYSFFLVPICALFHNAMVAYKIAILCNGVIWLLAYFYSIHVTKKMGNGSLCFRATSCFLIMILPIYAESRALVGPEALLTLLCWIAVSFICDLHKEEKKSKRTVFYLAIDVILAIWLNPIMISLAIGTGLYLLISYFQHKIEEEELLKWALLVVCGILIVTIIEQFFLRKVFCYTDATYSVGIQTLLETMITNWTTRGIAGFFMSFFGRIYSICINTFGLILPAVVLVYQECKKRKQSSGVIVYAGLVFLICILMVSCVYMGNGSEQDNTIYSLSMLPVVCGPLLFLSMEYLYKTKIQHKQILLGILGIFLIVAGLISVNNLLNISLIGSIHNNSGLFEIFRESGKSSTVIIFTAAAMMAVIWMVLAIFWRIREKIIKQYKMLSIGLTFVCFLVLGGYSLWTGYQIVSVKVVEENKTYTSKYQFAARVLRGTSGKVYYIESEEESDTEESDKFILQMLMGRKKLNWISNEDQTQEGTWEQIEKENAVILTSGDYEGWIDKLADYRVLYLDKNIVMWGKEDSNLQDEIDAVVCTKEKKAAKTSGGKTKEYGENIYLSPGTYVARYTLKVKKYKENQSIATMTVKDQYGTLQKIKLEDPGEETSITVEVPFTSKQVLEKVSFQISQGKGCKFTVSSVTYQKQSSVYNLGLNNQTEMEEIFSQIDRIDDLTGEKGKAAFVTEETGSLQYVQEQYGEIEVEKLDSVETEEIRSFDYLIFPTEPREYYDLLNDYTILGYSDSYVLLSPTDSARTQALEKEQGFSYSTGKRLDIRCFLPLNEEQEYNRDSSISLQSGSYQFIANLVLEKAEGVQGKIGTLYVMNGKKTVNSVDVERSQFGENNVCEVQVPFVCKVRMNGLKLTFEPEDGISVALTPTYIELNRKNFSVGVDDPSAMEEFASIIKNVNGESRVAYMVATAFDRSQQEDIFEDLRQWLPTAQLEANTFSELKERNDELFVITSGYSTAYFKMASQYTIIASSQNYLLWVSNDGSLLEQALKCGGTILSTDGKIAASCIRQMQLDGSISNLYAGKYRIYLSVELCEEKEYDTIEIGLVRNKTSDELEEEYSKLQDANYTEEEIDQLVNPVVYTETQIYSTEDFDHQSLITSMEIHCPKEMKNLEPVCMSKKGSKVEAQITWIEYLY
jgi:hypothetical protein